MNAQMSVETRSSKAGYELPSPPRSARWPTWIKCLPFLAMHLGCLAVFFVPVTLTALVLCAVLYVVRMFGITAGYHRYFSHRAYKTSRWFQFVLGFIGCTAMQKGPLWWAGQHREHHHDSDTPRDPHSPVVRGVWWSHIGWILSPKYEETSWPAVHDLGKYPELRWLNRYHWVPGLILAPLCYLLGGWSGLVWGGFVSTVLVYHAVFMVNSVCHLFGRRRYSTPDQSRNNVWVALATMGEGWHNNHHHYQSSTNQGFFWWEIDVTYYLIRLLECVGLVWDIRKPPQAILLVNADGKEATRTLSRSLPGDAHQTGRQTEENKVMLNLREMEQAILANGRVDGPELENLRQQMYAGGRIERREADFLVKLHKRVQHLTPAFEQFFYQAIKGHILAQGRIDAEETAWLRRMLFADGKIDDQERKLLHELKGEARQVSPEFDRLFEESMKQPQEQHTCG
jgi:stearoyl-CoA desaturase (delta-9 desaturase)